MNLCADIIFIRPLAERKSIIWIDCVCSSLLPKFLCFEVPIWINDRKKCTVNCALVDVAWRNCSMLCEITITEIDFDSFQIEKNMIVLTISFWL